MPIRHFATAAFAAIAILTACGRDNGAPANEAASSNDALPGNEALPRTGSVAQAPGVSLARPDGKILGTVNAGDGDQGAVLAITAEGLPPGVHGLHIHAVGKCEGPKFESAGPHWNPTNAQHGLENPRGPHLGDLPNITVGEDGRFTGQVTIQGSYLIETRDKRGPGGTILDADGAALIIHAAADDNRTDPSGNSGDRIACAVLAAPGERVEQ